MGFADIDPGVDTGDVQTRPRRAETRVGKPYPKNTHARTDAKHLLYRLDVPRKRISRCLWRPPKKSCI